MYLMNFFNILLIASFALVSITLAAPPMVELVRIVPTDEFGLWAPEPLPLDEDRENEDRTAIAAQLPFDQRPNVAPQSGQDCVAVKRVAYRPTSSSTRNGTRVDVRQDPLLSQLFSVEECLRPDQSCSPINDEDSDSKCFTQVSWQIALVRPKGTMNAWSFDYIFLPAGCECRTAVRRMTDDEWMDKK